MLEEGLLIIQNEFNGFSDTSERLDLLALDKFGNLVLIENKLDDTGKDVVWQALKYASYCSTLTTEQVITVYQEYLDKQGINEDAKTNIVESLQSGVNDLALNQGDQRVFLVANKFKKEVTATVLWLRNHDVNIHCFRAVPYSLNEEIFLQIELIIPLPETNDFIINIREKEKEEKKITQGVVVTNKYLIEFWKNFKELQSQNKITFLGKVSASSRWYLGFGRGKGRFNYCIGSKFFRVELYFSDDSDKTLFDKMYQFKNQIESCFPGTITWERLDNKRASRIKHDIFLAVHNSLPGIWGDFEREKVVHKWFMEKMQEFYSCLYPYLDKIN